MNKLLFLGKGLLLLCLFATLFAQSQTVNTTYKTQINAKFAGLDKNKIPTKLLINQAMEFAELTDYAGALSSTNHTTKGKFTNIYNTLLMARVQQGVSGLLSPTTFKTNWDNLRAPNKIILSGLFFKYNKFKANAYPNFLVNNNDVITDKYVNGVWQNPYTEQNVFAIAAPILLYKSLSFQVSLPASLWYTNNATAVQSIAIDFNEGSGYQTMALGQVRSINYTTAGTYEWKYKLTLTNGQVLYSHSKIVIDAEVPPTNNTTLKRTINQPCSQDAFGIDKVEFNGTKPYLGATNQAILEIDYAFDDCIIRKPLFVVEGFDSGLLGVENELGEVDFKKFRYNSLPNGGSSLLGQINTYDIIYINFKNGKDYLQRNAYLVEDVIKWVNSVKQGTQPNVVLGQSMGGVIARYALRDMEVNNENHQTNLYISHDAPHQGANIPVGVQYFARHLADQFIDTPAGDYQISLEGNNSVSIADIQNLFNAVGTKQLLANYINSDFVLDNSAFNDFQTELRNLEYPQQTRNIALSNGNHCANPQSFNPSANLFSLNGGASTTELTTLLTVLIEPITGISVPAIAFEFNEPGLLLGILPGSSSFDMNFSANALPVAGTSNQVYHGSISYTKKIFSLFGWSPKITVSLTDRSYNNPVPLSYDYYPGGNYQLPFNFSTSTINNHFINLGISANLAPSFNFIPTPSALDVGNGNAILNNSDYFFKYNAATPPTGSKTIPFNNFSTSHNTSSLNEEHISFNTRNGNWLALELDNIANNEDIFNCAYICSSGKIEGNNIICTTANYSAPNGVPFYNWTITQGSNLVSLTGNGTPNITLTALPNQSGQLTLSLTLGDDGAKCGNKTLTKSIWVGKPILSYETDCFNAEIGDSNCFSMCRTNYFEIQNYREVIANGLNLIANNSDWEWQKVTTNFAWSTNNNTAYFQPYQTGYIAFKVRVKNACGWSNWLLYQINVTNCSNNGGSFGAFKQADNTFVIYPNPSKDIVNIELRDRNNLPEKDAKVSGELFDLLGFSKAKVEIQNNKAIFSVRNLNKGIYILKIYINDQIESHQIAVE